MTRNHLAVRILTVRDGRQARPDEVAKPKPYVDNFLVQRLIRDDVFLDHDQKLLLFFLTTHRNVYTLECDPSVKTLAINFCRSVRTIQRVMATLEKQSYIITVKRGYGRESNHYFLWDFREAFKAYQCPEFKGNKHTLLKANRKRFAKH